MAFFNDDKNFKRPQSRVQEAILILTYAAIILSISATISALALTDEFGEIPSRASRDPLHTTHPAESIEAKNWDILRHFGARKSTRWITYHCESIDTPFFSLITTKLYRVCMLATGWFMCHCLHHCVCCYTRDADSYSRLRHHWRRDPTSLMSFLRASQIIGQETFMEHI